MRNESVALLDVRSYEITFFLGSRGVNDTFVFCGSYTEKYEGFSKEGFFDVQSFRDAVKSAVNHVKQNYGGVIDEVYVGVPSNFLSLRTKGRSRFTVVSWHRSTPTLCVGTKSGICGPSTVFCAGSPVGDCWPCGG